MFSKKKLYFLISLCLCFTQIHSLSSRRRSDSNNDNANNFNNITNSNDNINETNQVIPKWKKQACAIALRNRYTRYKCDERGNLKCLPGWQGDLCDVPLCRKNCDPQQGYCSRPGECRCKIGFQGRNCEKCITLPGCQYGTCRQAFECKCIGGWRGILCQEPICRKGCHPTHGYCDSPGECECRIGWTGATCSDCQRLPGCVHGTCNSPMQCLCLPGYTGFLCDKAICSEKCHKNNGYCRTPGTCRCKVGWMGDDCNTCHKYPGCKNGYCLRPWECICEEGWGGFLCDEELNYCELHPNTCENGGKCRSLSKEDGNFSCDCLVGYRGDRCERSNNTTMPMTSISWDENNVLVITPFPISSEGEKEKPLLSERNATTISTSTNALFHGEEEITTTKITSSTLETTSTSSLQQEELSTTKVTQNTDDNANQA